MIATKLILADTGTYDWKILLAEPGEGKTWIMILYACVLMSRGDQAPTELVMFCNSELTRLQMTHIVNIHKPEYGQVMVYSGNDFSAAVK